jgi:hypothetical protein
MKTHYPSILTNIYSDSNDSEQKKLDSLWGLWGLWGRAVDIRGENFLEPSIQVTL